MLLLRPHSPLLFRLTGYVLVTIAFSLSAFGFTYFRVSNWNAETISLALNLLTAISLLWIAGGLLMGYLKSYWVRGHALMLLWLCFVAWQLLPTLASTLPLRSWLGPPEQGEGMTWYISVSTFMLMFSALWRWQKFMSFLIHYTLCLITALAFIHFVTDDQNNLLQLYVFPLFSRQFMYDWLPFVWPDYLGYMIAWWWIAAQFILKKPSRSLQALHLVIILFVLVASSNRIAMILIGSAVLISMLVRSLHHFGLPLFARIYRPWRQMTLAVLLLPLAWLLISAWSGFEVKYGNKFYQSIPTRVILNHVALTAIAEEPSRLILGKGWGQFQDDFFKHALVRGIRVYTNGYHFPNWHLIRGYNYHTHNMAAETLLALGLVGFLLWLAMPIVAAGRLPDRYFWRVMPVFVGVTVLQHFWFAVPQTVPFQALSWFVLMRKIRFPNTRRIAIAKAPIITLALIFAALLMLSAKIQYQTVQYNMRLADPFGKFSDGSMVTTDYMKTDIARGGSHLRAQFINYTKRLALNYERVTPDHIELYMRYIEASKAMSDTPTIGAYNAAALLYGYNVALSGLHHPIYLPIKQEAAENYPHYALLHTKRAPKREDIIAPLLYALYNMKDDPEHERALELAQQLLEVNPSHRSALWVAGKIMAQKKGYEQQGLEMMRAALAMGADRIYLITNAEIIDVMSAK